MRVDVSAGVSFIKRMAAVLKTKRLQQLLMNATATVIKGALGLETYINRLLSTLRQQKQTVNTTLIYYHLLLT